MIDSLKSRRSELMLRTLSSSTPMELFAVQLELADEIRRAERAKNTTDADDIGWHIHLLRCCGDSLAWRYLHSHAIRQLSKNQPTRPSIAHQGAAFDFTLTKAREAAEAGRPALVADLTHCLRIGDLVLATDPERPELVECKLSTRPEHFALQGRRGRQLSRMRGTIEYLRTGRARVYGEELTRQVVEIDIGAEFNWSIVGEVCSNAQTSGNASAMLSNGELIFATTEEDSTFIPKEIREGAFLPRYSVIGSHFVPIEEAWSSVPPPLNWAIPIDTRIALQEGDVMLCHIFDPHVVVGYSNSMGIVVAVETCLGEDAHGYRIRIGQTEMITGGYFTRSLLYGYETAQSMAERMLDFGSKLLAIVPPEVHPLLAEFD